MRTKDKVNFTIDHQLIEVVEILSRETGMAKSEIVELLIREGLERITQRVSYIAKKILEVMKERGELVEEVKVDGS